LFAAERMPLALKLTMRMAGIDRDDGTQAYRANPPGSQGFAQFQKGC
jgi:hypothetical protein